MKPLLLDTNVIVDVLRKRNEHSATGNETSVRALPRLRPPVRPAGALCCPAIDRLRWLAKVKENS